jgi:membrane-bound metal-dependent hydrolase YbcI (DUF457 family)
MPSPVAHGLVGLTVHILASRDRSELRDPWRLGVTLGAALLPDLDLSFRLLDGRNHHSGELHSVGAAVLVAAAAAVFFSLRHWRRPIGLAVTVGLAWCSHLLLDYLNVDTNPPIGLLALWPFSRSYFKFPYPIFMDIGRTLDWTTVRHDVAAVAWECAILVPLLLVTWHYRGRRGRWHEDSRAKP